MKKSRSFCVENNIQDGRSFPSLVRSGKTPVAAPRFSALQDIAGIWEGYGFPSFDPPPDDSSGSLLSARQNTFDWNIICGANMQYIIFYNI